MAQYGLQGATFRRKAPEHISFDTTLNGEFLMSMTSVGNPLVVDWGDGSDPETLTFDVPGKSFTHTYATGAQKTITLHSTDRFAGVEFFDIDSMSCLGDSGDFFLLPDLTDGLDLYSNAFTGDMPVPSLSRGMQYYDLHDNQYSGSFPDLRVLALALSIDVSTNQLSSYVAGSLATLLKLTEFYANDNKFSTSDINAILADLVTNQAARSSDPGCFVDLSGQSPAAPPSGQGITDKNTLIANGWTVTVDA